MKNPKSQTEPSASGPQRRFLVVTPCRDEEEHVARTIASMVEQTVPPTRWVIVDDGSTDRTPEILADAAREHDFISVVRREDRGGRSVGPGVIEAFYSGVESVDIDSYDYICKLDGDLELPPRYFEKLIETMEREPRLGTFSGKVYLRDPSGDLTHEHRGDENSVGPSKFYRRECFQDIGGFARVVGWDGIDGHLCRMHGWIARSADDPELRLIHSRQMGSSDRGVFRGRIRGGRGKWIIGNSFPFLLATACFRMFQRPYVIGAVLMVWGYLDGFFRGVPRFGDAAYRRHVRRFEREALLFGKSRTLEKWNARLAAGPAGAPESSTPSAS